MKQLYSIKKNSIKKNLVFLLFFFLIFIHTKNISQIEAITETNLCTDTVKTSEIISILQALIFKQNEFATEQEEANNKSPQEETEKSRLLKSLSQVLEPKLPRAHNFASPLQYLKALTNLFRSRKNNKQFIVEACIPPEFNSTTFINAAELEGFFYCETEEEQNEIAERIPKIISSQNRTKGTLSDSHLTTEEILDLLNTATEQAAQYEAFIQCMQCEAGPTGLPIDCFAGICSAFIPSQYLQGDIFYDQVDDFVHGLGINSVAWRDSTYLAIGGEDAGANLRLRILKFDATTNALTPVVDSTLATSDIQAVAWSIDMLYLAYSNSTEGLSVTEFDATSGSENLTFKVNTNSSLDGPIDWLQTTNNYYIASTTGASQNTSQIFEFDPITPGIEEIIGADYNHGATINSTSWRDGTYLAIGGEPNGPGNPEIRVLIFDSNTLSLTEYANFTISQVTNSVDWSPDGTYLVIGSDKVTVLPEEPGNLTVLKFDPTKSFAERLTIFETINIQSNNISPDNATSAKWSPDGKFIATTSRYNGDVKGFSKVFAFDPTKPKDERLTEIGSYDTSTALPNSTDWDTIGKYVATGGFGGVFPEINVLLLCQGTVGPCP